MGLIPEYVKLELAKYTKGQAAPVVQMAVTDGRVIWDFETLVHDALAKTDGATPGTKEDADRFEVVLFTDQDKTQASVLVLPNRVCLGDWSERPEDWSDHDPEGKVWNFLERLINS